MAFTDEDDKVLITTSSVTYAASKPYQIIGLPYRTSDSDWRIRPHASMHTSLVTAAWEGTIPAGGCQFFVRDEFSPDLVSSGGTYYVNGLVNYALKPTSEIVQKTWDYLDTESRDAYFDSGTGSITQTAIKLTRISIVYETGGIYFLSNNPVPDDGPIHEPFSFPANFMVTTPL